VKFSGCYAHGPDRAAIAAAWSGHRSHPTLLNEVILREGGHGLAGDIGFALARRCAVTSWRKRVEEYVELRRSLGFKLLEAKVGLIQFAAFLQQRAARHA
jgi:hypothetical protein